MRALLAFALVLSVGLAGCTVTLGQHQPSVDTVTHLRESGIAKLNVGRFALAANAKPELDKRVTSRGSEAIPPNGQTFSEYLKEALTTDLKAAGLFDASSPLAVQGQLISGSLDTGMSTGNLSLEAHFTVVRGDQAVFDKTLKDTHSWPSSFMGAVAIPEALNQYAAAFGDILQMLYADADFRKACAAPTP